MAIAALHNLKIHQMDVKTAFLNGELNEEIYMEQPKGFIVPVKKRKCVGLLNFFMDYNKLQSNGMRNLTMQ